MDTLVVSLNDKIGYADPWGEACQDASEAAQFKTVEAAEEFMAFNKLPKDQWAVIYYYFDD
jgi:hypothetical protein